MIEFKEYILEIEEYKKDNENPILLIEIGNTTEIIYAIICLYNLKQRGHHTILLTDKKYANLTHPSIDKLITFDTNYKFRYKYREYMLKKQYQWLMPNPKLALQFPELMLQTHLVIDQYMQNSGFTTYDKNIIFKAKPTEQKQKLVLGKIEDAQEIIYAARRKNIYTYNLSGYPYQISHNRPNSDITEQINVIGQCSIVIGNDDDNILSLACCLENKPLILEKSVDKYSSVREIFNYDKCINVESNSDIISFLNTHKLP